MKTFPEEEALRLYREGLTDTEIAKRIGYKRRRVGCWRQKNNLPTQNAHQRRILQLNQVARPLYDNGASDTEIALETGFTKGDVRRWRNQYHLPRNRTESDIRPETPEAQCGLSYGQYHAILNDPRIDNPEAVLSRLRARHKETEEARRQRAIEEANWWKNWHPIHWG